jgi:hypothetical protein
MPPRDIVQNIRIQIQQHLLPSSRCRRSNVLHPAQKAGRFVELDDGETVTRLSVKELTENDATISLCGLTLRVIRSPKSQGTLVCSDQTNSRTKVIRIYYHRFEIEETFKDVKHIFELKRTRLNKPLSLKFLFLVC